LFKQAAITGYILTGFEQF